LDHPNVLKYTQLERLGVCDNQLILINIQSKKLTSTQKRGLFTEPEVRLTYLMKRQRHACADVSCSPWPHTQTRTHTYTQTQREKGETQHRDDLQSVDHLCSARRNVQLISQISLLRLPMSGLAQWLVKKGQNATTRRVAC